MAYWHFKYHQIVIASGVIDLVVVPEQIMKMMNLKIYCGGISMKIRAEAHNNDDDDDLTPILVYHLLHW